MERISLPAASQIIALLTITCKHLGSNHTRPEEVYIYTLRKRMSPVNSPIEDGTGQNSGEECMHVYKALPNSQSKTSRQISRHNNYCSPEAVQVKAPCLTVYPVTV